MAGKTPETPGDFDVRITWRRNDPVVTADAIAMWTRLGVLPEDITAEDRAKQLVGAAYSGDRLAAVCTAVVQDIAFLRARFLVMRSMTDPDFRRSHAQVAMAQPVMRFLEQWAKENPEEKIAGLLGFVEPGAWGPIASMPVGPFNAWTLVAYAKDGTQIRAVWFDHYRVDVS